MHKSSISQRLYQISVVYRKDAWESGREKLPELWKVYRSQAVAPLLSFLRIFFDCVFDLILCHLLYLQMISRYFR